AVNNDFVWPEAVALMMLTMMFCYRLPRELLIIMTAAALLLQPDVLNETGAKFVLVYTAGLMFLPKRNMAILYYGLPAFALLLVMTHSRTAIAVFILVTIIQLSFISLYKREKKHQRNFLVILLASALIHLMIFFRPLFSFFTMDGLGSDGIDWNHVTNGRYEPWMPVVNNMTWFGEGRSYIDFTSLLHVHNIFLDTLGRYGIITAVLFTLLMSVALILA